MDKFKKLAVNNVLTDLEVNIADTFFKKALGLMFSKNSDKALLINDCNSIHTFFMNFDINAVFLDKNSRILHIKSNIKPWRIVLPVISAKKVLEIPFNKLNADSFKIGDLITFS